MAEQLTFFDVQSADDGARDEDGKLDGVDRAGWVTAGQYFDGLTAEGQREHFEQYQRTTKDKERLTFEVYALALYRPRTGQPGDWKARIKWARERLGAARG